MVCCFALSLLVCSGALRPGSLSFSRSVEPQGRISLRRFRGSRDVQASVDTDAGELSSAAFRSLVENFSAALQENLDQHEEERIESEEFGFQRATSAVPIVDHQVHSIDGEALGMGKANPFHAPDVVETAQIFSARECENIRDEAESKIRLGAQSNFTMTDTNRDVAVHELPQTLAWLNSGAFARITSMAASCFPDVVEDATSLWIYSGLVIYYDAEAGLTHQPIHRDGSLISCTVPLNKREEYDGGGTWVEPLGRAIALEQGCALLHPSAVRHAGHRITRGVRWVLVLFMNHLKMHYGEHGRRFHARAHEYSREEEEEEEEEGKEEDWKETGIEKMDAESQAFEVISEEDLDAIIDQNDGDHLSDLEEDQELQCLMHALRVTDQANHEILYELGQHAFNYGDMKSALRWYEKAAEINDVDPLLLGCTGVVLEILGRKREAFRYYRRAMRSEVFDFNADLNARSNAAGLLLSDGRLRALAALLKHTPAEMKSHPMMQRILVDTPDEMRSHPMMQRIVEDLEVQHSLVDDR